MLPWSRNRSRSKLHWLHIPASGYIASSLLVRVLLATLRSPGYPTTSWPNCALWSSRRTSGCPPIQSSLENAEKRSEARSKSIEKWYTEHTSIQDMPYALDLRRPCNHLCSLSCIVNTRGRSWARQQEGTLLQ